MREEMNSLWKNDTYELIELPKRRKSLKNKWVFKLKNDDEKLLKYKARLMVKGFGQKQGIDFDEIFSLVVKMCSIRVILGLATSMNLELKQLDVKTTFLHGDCSDPRARPDPIGESEPKPRGRSVLFLFIFRVITFSFSKMSRPESLGRPKWRIRTGAWFTPTFLFILSKIFY